MTNRIGHGYDLHRLEPHPPEGEGRPFMLGGVKLDFEKGPVGHSDGDAVYHAVTDAVLGALCEPDIGQLFPDTDPKNEAADSSAFVKVAAQKMRHHGYKIGNIDVTVIRHRARPIHRYKVEVRLGRLQLCCVDPTAEQ